MFFVPFQSRILLLPLRLILEPFKGMSELKQRIEPTFLEENTSRGWRFSFKIAE